MTSSPQATDNMSNRFFPPCFLLLATVACLAIIGVWSYYFVQGPDGSAFTPAPPTSAPTAASPTNEPTDTPALFLGSVECPRQVCEVRPVFVAQCNASSINAFCMVDDLRPLCTLGVCQTHQERVECMPTVDLVSVTFACSCTCDGGVKFGNN